MASQKIITSLEEQKKWEFQGYVTVDINILEYAHGADRNDVLKRHSAFVISQQRKE